ncbi:FAD/NAD(P)-binding protein [Novosphingobium sp. 9]|uniref:FAD/NAD(P)-binding protein n=1 Tax=Novosphingobium sp. 9 TaxID=2025349 RepID=UPI0021B646C4|nr:FAD/NAD(P)-binding protein [Novosphingobium sp. 9]
MTVNIQSDAPSDHTLPVAVIGGGFTGTLVAVNLLRNGVDVVLIERSEPQLGRGLAFGTPRAEHLLNVRAANMGAFPDDPRHFLKWMNPADEDEANRFVPRRLYGAYLRDLLDEAAARHSPRLRIVRGEACDVRFTDCDVAVTMTDGSTEKARSLVLALGNFPPVAHPALSALPPALYTRDPWQAGALEGIDKLDHVLLVGTGLTAADMVLSLDNAGFKGRITLLSRRGLRPHAHAELGPAVSPVPEPQARGSALLHAVRARAKEVDWRAAVDELRPFTQNLWRRHDVAAQRRFLRHLRPYWDIHRHRLAPQVARRLHELENEGRLIYAAGKLAGSAEGDGQAHISYRPRGETDLHEITVDRVLNCAGPDSDVTQCAVPIVRTLLTQGLLRPDTHRLGIDIDQLGRVRDAGGRVNPRLFAAGPPTKGEAWEIIAVPDIRRQAWDIARYLADAHWVGGEGL